MKDGSERKLRSGKTYMEEKTHLREGSTREKVKRGSMKRGKTKYRISKAQIRKIK